MDNPFPQDPRPLPGSPSLPEPSTGHTPHVEPAAKIEATRSVAPQTSAAPAQNNAVATPADQLKTNGDLISGSASTQRGHVEPHNLSVSSLSANPPASDQSESQTTKLVSEAGEAGANAERQQIPVHSDPPRGTHGGNQVGDQALSQSNLNPASAVPSRVATGGQQTSESRAADKGEVIPSAEGNHAAVGPSAAINPALVEHEYPEDSPADLKRIAQRILARRVGSIPQQRVEANASRIRGLKSLGFKVKEIYTDLVIDERINADKVSYKQFADQVKKLTT